MLYVGWMGLGWMAIILIGHRSSKSVFGANRSADMLLQSSVSIKSVFLTLNVMTAVMTCQACCTAFLDVHLVSNLLTIVYSQSGTNWAQSSPCASTLLPMAASLHNVLVLNSLYTFYCFHHFSLETFYSLHHFLTTSRTNCSRGKVSKDVVKTIGGEINSVPGN